LRSWGVVALASGHRQVLRATTSGLLDVDDAALQQMNAIPGVAVYTRRGGDVVEADQVIAHAQITPLAIARPALATAEQIARAQPVLRLRSFVPRDAVLWKRDDRLVLPLTEMLRRFGCELRRVLDLPGDAAAIRASLQASGAPLVLIAGTNALDPLDPVFVALEALGATILRRGIPVHPGTLLWIATLGDTTIVGLPPCGLKGAFELVLPRLLAGDVAFSSLGHGGDASSADRSRRETPPSMETVEEEAAR
jgi:formylmethanofuran dehydrogenase subunit E